MQDRVAPRPEPLLPDPSVVAKWRAAKRQPPLFQQLNQAFDAVEVDQHLVHGLLNVAGRRDRAHTAPANRARGAGPPAARRISRATGSRAPPDEDGDESEPGPDPGVGVEAPRRCRYCGKVDPDSEWGVLRSNALGARCCSRCYRRKAARR